MKRIVIVLAGLSAAVGALALGAFGAERATRLTASLQGGGATTEGRAVSIRVRLSAAARGRVSVSYATVDGTATAGTDYAARKGTLVFKRGQQTKTVRVPVVDDSVAEKQETFSFRLSRPRGVRLGGSSATVVIAKNDIPAQFTLRAFMDGIQDAPHAGGRGDPTARGTATFVFDAEAERVSYTVTIEGATQRFDLGHIHPGAPPNLRGHGMLTFTEFPPLNGTSSGSAALALKDIAEVHANPGAFWVQLHKYYLPDAAVDTIGGPFARVS